MINLGKKLALLLILFPGLSSLGAENPTTWDGQLERLNEGFKTEEHEHKKHMNPSGESGTKLVLKALDVIDGDTILDLCSGWGGPAITLAEEMNKKGNKITLHGIEISETSYRKAEEYIEKADIGDSKIELHNHSISYLPFEENTFDQIMGVDPDGVAYVENREKLFKDLYRVLKPGGKIVFKHWVPNLNESESIKTKFDEINSWQGVSPQDINADSYFKAMNDAGFEVKVENISDFYHEAKIEIKNRLKEKGKSDDWLEKYLKLESQSSVGFGALFIGVKPITSEETSFNLNEISF